MPFKYKVIASANISHLLTGRPWKDPDSSFFFFFLRGFTFSWANVKILKMLDFDLNPLSELWNVYLTFSSQHLSYRERGY